MPEIGSEVVTRALSNNLFAHLKERSFAARPRLQERLPGMRSALRATTPKDLHDMSRHHEIDVRTYEDGTLAGTLGTKRELELFAARGVEPGAILFAVSGSPSHPKLDTKEIGELQGWVGFYKNEPSLINRAIRAGILEKSATTSNRPIVEVSYGKYAHAPEKQMQDGLLQALYRLSRAAAEAYPTDTIPPTVTACVEPRNKASARMLEKAGFEPKGRLQYDLKHPTEEPDVMYVLNWGKYNTILRERMKEELIASGKGMLVGESTA